MTALDTHPIPTTTDGDDIGHLVCCCNEDLAMCGADVTDEPWGADDTPECVVCRDLWPDETDCPRCGCTEC